MMRATTRINIRQRARMTEHFMSSLKSSPRQNPDWSTLDRVYVRGLLERLGFLANSKWQMAFPICFLRARCSDTAKCGTTCLLSMLIYGKPKRITQKSAFKNGANENFGEVSLQQPNWRWRSSFWSLLICTCRQRSCVICQTWYFVPVVNDWAGLFSKVELFYCSSIDAINCMCVPASSCSELKY